MPFPKAVQNLCLCQHLLRISDSKENPMYAILVYRVGGSLFNSVTAHKTNNSRQRIFLCSSMRILETKPWIANIKSNQ